jgi:Spy/CpxP family protein refolding chaperone
MPAFRSFVLAALIAAFIVPLAAGAQSAPPPPAAASQQGAGAAAHHRHHGHSLWHDMKKLNLTPAQRQRAMAARDAIRKANATADVPTKQANRAKLRQQMLGILTPSQRSQLQAMHQPHGAAAPDGAQDPNATPH